MLQHACIERRRMLIHAEPLHWNAQPLIPPYGNALTFKRYARANLWGKGGGG